MTGLKIELKNKWIILMLMFALILGSMPLESAAQNIKVVVGGNVKIMLNGSFLQSDVPPATANDRLLLPVSVIFKALGAEVQWDGKNQVVTAVKGDRVIKLTVGSYVMTVNGSPVELEVPALLVSNRVLIPVRAVAEAMALEVLWHGADNIAELRDSFYIAKEHSLVVGGKALYIGQSESEVIRLLGEPQRKDSSEYGFSWYIYSADYSEYMQVGIKEGKVVGLYTNAKGFGYDGSITQGMTETALKKSGSELESAENGRLVQYSNGSEVHYFIDLHDQSILTSILILEYNTSLTDPNKILKGQYLTDFLKGQERQIMDLGNAIRARKGLTPFAWNDQIAAVALLHSKDMASRDFFDHVNPDGKSPFDRMAAGGVRYSAAAENIAAGYQSAIFAHEAWMNSIGHRTALLSQYTKFGGGVYYAVQEYGIYCYYTENFFTPR